MLALSACSGGVHWYSPQGSRKSTHSGGFFFLSDQRIGQRVKIFSGTSNRPLAEKIAASIQMPLGKCTVSAFPDGETFVKIEENVRGEDVFLVQSTSPPTNQNLMEMFIMMDALRRSSASRMSRLPTASRSGIPAIYQPALPPINYGSHTPPFHATP